MQPRDPVSFPATIPTIETDRLTLRALTPDDRAAVFALFADPRVAVPTHVAPFAGVEQADELIASFGRRFAAKGGIRWGLTLRGDDAIIGTAGFPGVDAEAYRARIGYNLAHAHWGRGLATEAVRALAGSASRGSISSGSRPRPTSTTRARCACWRRSASPRKASCATMCTGVRWAPSPTRACTRSCAVNTLGEHRDRLSLRHRRVSQQGHAGIAAPAPKITAMA